MNASGAMIPCQRPIQNPGTPRRVAAGVCSAKHAASSRVATSAEKRPNRSRGCIPSLHREWWVLVTKQEHIRFDARSPPKHADAEPIERLRIRAEYENAEPGDARDDRPRDAQR